MRWLSNERASTMSSVGLLAIAALVGSGAAISPPAKSQQPAVPFSQGQDQVLRGRFLVISHACGGCHGGADNPTGMGRFTERQIFNALRYGLRPGETPDVEITSSTPGQGNFPAHPKYLAVPMPWPAWRHMPDQDLWAIAAYLKHALKPVTNKVQDSEGPPDFWASEYTAEKIGTYPAPAFPTAVRRSVK